MWRWRVRVVATHPSQRSGGHIRDSISNSVLRRYVKRGQESDGRRGGAEGVQPGGREFVCRSWRGEFLIPRRDCLRVGMHWQFLVLVVSGLVGTWELAGTQANFTLLEPLQVLQVGGWRAVRIEGPPKLPVIKEGSRLVLDVHAVTRMVVAIARLSVLEKSFEYSSYEFPRVRPEHIRVEAQAQNWELGGRNSHSWRIFQRE